MRVLVVNVGGDEAAWRAAQVRFGSFGYPLARIITPAPMQAANGAGAAADLGAVPLRASSRDVARLFGHRAAWSQAVDAGGPVLIVDDDAEPTAELPAVLDAFADPGDHPVVVSHDGVPPSGYLLSPEAARRLIAAEAELDSEVMADPPAVRVTSRRAGPLVAERLHVIENVDDAENVPPDDVVLVLPPGAAVVGTGVTPGGAQADVLAAFADAEELLDAPVLGAGGALVGRAAAVAEGVGAVSDEGMVFGDPGARHVLVLNGRMTDVVTGAHPPVALRPLVDDAGTRDLARILRYDDAVDDRDEVHDVASDMVLVPFWTPSFCTTIVRAAEAAEAWGADEDDPVPGMEISLATISARLFEHVRADLSERALPVLRQRWPYVEDAGLRDAFVIKYTPGAASLRMHHDLSQLSGSVRLNDGYEGGELIFPRQHWSNAHQPVGALVAWPSLVTHPHASRPVERGVKYNLTIWWELPGR